MWLPAWLEEPWLSFADSAEGFVCDLIPSSRGSAGWEGTGSFSAQNAFLQMKELAFIIIIIILLLLLI